MCIYILCILLYIIVGLPEGIILLERSYRPFEGPACEPEAPYNCCLVSTRFKGLQQEGRCPRVEGDIALMKCCWIADTDNSR